MAHYAFLDENNIVTEVIVGIDETELIEGLDPETWYGNFRGQTCKRTSYNSYAGENKNGGESFRYNYALIGSRFDATKGTDGAFIPPKPFESWILNETTYVWDAPVLQPEFDEDNPKAYIWDEETISWIEIEMINTYTL